MVTQLSLRSGRQVILEHLATPIPFDAIAPFAALLPAYDVLESLKVKQLVTTLLQLGCIEVCCVGPLAESLHDALDAILEEKGALDVVTTWHTDAIDACEYFLFGAGGGLVLLRALIREHPELVTLLERTAQSD